MIEEKRQRVPPLPYLDKGEDRRNETKYERRGKVNEMGCNKQGT